MDNREFDELGEKIQDIIDKAVNSKNYQKLNQDINQTVNKAIDTGSEALKNALNSAFSSAENYAKKYENKYENKYESRYENKTRQFEERRRRERMQEAEARRQKAKEKKNLPALYGKVTGVQVKGLLMSVAGGIFTGGMGLGCLLLLLSGAAAEAGIAVWSAAMAGATALSAGVLAGGFRRLGKAGRFKKYISTLGQHTYCNFEQLSEAVGKPVKFVKKDVKSMISKGWFLQGHVDSQETCLITSNETYSQYVETQKQMETRQQEAEKRAESGKVSAQVQEVLDKGNDYLRKIRESNDAIPGEEISAKISRMELIVEKIFERARNHPEIIPDLKKLMDYYLPMTVKLLDAYEDMDNQPIQGENISSSKREIEETLDTLNQAFEKLLDSIFQDTAWDVSSDISVLHAMLAQEGLTENDFEKMKQNR